MNEDKDISELLEKAKEIQCGVKINYLGNTDREVNHARIKKALTITR